MSQQSVTPFAAAGKPETLQSLLAMDVYKSRFEQVLGKRAPQFISSILSLGATMRDVEPRSVIAAAAVAASLDLPIEKNFGFAHIVPYKKNGVKYGSFQLGAKGYVQLAMRTAAYSRMNAEVVNAEAYKGRDEVGEPIIDWDEIDPDKPAAGYAFSFKLINGFTKVCYWTKKKVEAHAKRYSQAYKSDYDTPWKSEFDKMALKTVVANELRRWGILSVELQGAFAQDATIRKDIDAPPEYPEETDAIGRPVFDGETGKPIEDPADVAAESAAGLAPAQQPSDRTATQPMNQSQKAATTSAEDSAAAAKAQEALQKTRARKGAAPKQEAVPPLPQHPPLPPSNVPQAPPVVAEPPAQTTEPAQAPAQEPENPPASAPEPSVADALGTPAEEPPEPEQQQQQLPGRESYDKLMKLLEVGKMTEAEVMSVCHRRGLATAEQKTLAQLSDKKLEDLALNIAPLSAQIRLDRKSKGPKT